MRAVVPRLGELPLEIVLELTARDARLLAALAPGEEKQAEAVLVTGQLVDDVEVVVRRVGGMSVAKTGSSATPARYRRRASMMTPLYLTVAEQPGRLKDKFLNEVERWSEGCLLCGAEARSTLPLSEGRLTLPLCPRHVRWAMACRKERVGKQARRLKKLLYAWCRLHGDDLEVAKQWLGY